MSFAPLQEDADTVTPPVVRTPPRHMATGTLCPTTWIDHHRSRAHSAVYLSLVRDDEEKNEMACLPGSHAPMRRGRKKQQRRGQPCCVAGRGHCWFGLARAPRHAPGSVIGAYTSAMCLRRECAPSLLLVAARRAGKAHSVHVRNTVKISLYDTRTVAPHILSPTDERPATGPHTHVIGAFGPVPTDFVNPAHVTYVQEASAVRCHSCGHPRCSHRLLALPLRGRWRAWLEGKARKIKAKQANNRSRCSMRIADPDDRSEAPTGIALRQSRSDARWHAAKPFAGTWLYTCTRFLCGVSKRRRCWPPASGPFHRLRPGQGQGHSIPNLI
nr:unnamed protein product [Digitaria exilis]